MISLSLDIINRLSPYEVNSLGSGLSFKNHRVIEYFCGSPQIFSTKVRVYFQSWYIDGNIFLQTSFSDGTVIWHNSAIDTFIEALRYIGLDRIPQVGIKHAGYDLVG